MMAEYLCVIFFQGKMRIPCFLLREVVAIQLESAFHGSLLLPQEVRDAWKLGVLSGFDVKTLFPGVALMAAGFPHVLHRRGLDMDVPEHVVTQLHVTCIYMIGVIHGCLFKSKPVLQCRSYNSCGLGSPFYMLILIYFCFRN